MTIWRVVFLVAALFNFAAGLPGLLAPGLNAAGLGGDGSATALLMTQLIGAMVAVFGIGYALVAFDPPAHRGIVWMGAAGKAVVIVLLAEAWTRGVIPDQTAALGVGDTIFVILFLLFLARTRPA